MKHKHIKFLAVSAAFFMSVAGTAFGPSAIPGGSALSSLLGLSGTASATSKTTEKTYKVLSVIDGDTIKINYNGKTTPVRLIGVDAPETSSKATTKTGCYAAQSKAYLTRRLSGKYVTLKSDPLSGDKDYYGRLLRYVYLGSEEIDRTLVLNGYAREYKFWLNNYTRRSSYLSAQSSAKSARRGLWNLNICKMNK